MKVTPGPNVLNFLLLKNILNPETNKKAFITMYIFLLLFLGRFSKWDIPCLKARIIIQYHRELCKRCQLSVSDIVKKYYDLQLKVLVSKHSFLNVIIRA